jgi:hypothetical protein
MADNKTDYLEETSPVEAAEAALDRLASKLAPPSIGAQIRRLLPKIETAFEAGATHEQILETLRESGIKMTLATFRSALYRARKKRGRDEQGSRKKNIENGQSPEATHVPGQRSDKGAEGKQRNPLAIPPRPKTFEWDPTERPKVTFVTKKSSDSTLES